MFRISQSSFAIGLLAFGSLTLGFGCHVIAGLEDRDLTSGAGGAGGANASSSGEMTAVVASSSGNSSSSSSSSSGMPMGCATNPPGSPGCEAEICSGQGEATTGCHCGNCGIDCGNGVGGQCLTGGLCPPKLIAYTPDDGRIHRVAAHGGVVVYAEYDELQATSKIRGNTLNGTPLPDNIAVNIDGYVQAIAVDCDKVFFATTPRSNSAGISMGKYALWWVRIMNGMPTEFPEMNDFYGSQFESIVVDDRNVYWTDERGVGVWPKPGGPMMANPVRVPMHDLKTAAVGLAVRGNDLYWSTTDKNGDSGEGLILHTLVTSFPPGPPTTKATYSAARPRQIAVDNTDIYWVDASNVSPHSVKTIPRSAGAGAIPTTLYTFQTLSLFDPISVDPSDSYVHVITYDNTKTSSSTCRLKKGGAQTGCEPHSGSSTGIEIAESWFVREGSRLYLATPKLPGTETGRLHWITVGKLNP